MKKKNINENKRSVIAMVIIFIVFLLSIYLLKLNRDRLLEVEISNTDEETIIYEKHFALILKDSYDLPEKTIYEGAKQKGEELSIYVENFADYLPVSYTINDKLKMAIASKVDGIIIHADSDEEINNQIKEAKTKGIPVVTVLDDMPFSGRISFIGVNQYQLGKYYGNQIFKIIKASNDTLNNIKILIDSKDNSPEILLSGIKESLPMSNLKIDLIPIDRQSAFSSEETMHDIIVGQEDFVDIIVCLNATDTISAYQTYIAGMDTFARGLKVAAKLIEDRVFEDFKEDRYSSYNDGIGKDILDGKVGFKELEAYAQENGVTPNKSGRQEYLEGILNQYIMETK